MNLFQTKTSYQNMNLKKTSEKARKTEKNETSFLIDEQETVRPKNTLMMVVKKKLHQFQTLSK